MSFIDDLWSVAKPSVSKADFYKIVDDLFRHMGEHEYHEQVIDVFEQALDLRGSPSDRGIDEGEIEEGIARLLKHKKIPDELIMELKHRLLTRLRKHGMV